MIITAIAVILGLGLLVGFHEAAHMLVSKLLGVKVNRFAIGFGPVLLKKTIGETSYEIRILPLGGFVQCDGENPASKVKRGFFSLPWYKRSMIALAGPVASLLFGYILFYACLVLGRGWPILAAFGKAWVLCYTVIAETLKIFSGHLAPGESVSGPIMVIKVMADSLKDGFVRFGSVLSVISLSLGFFNLLPVPALDGGHAFLYLIEGVRGKKFKPVVYSTWSAVGAILLVALMLYTMFGDAFTIWGKR